MAAEVLVAGAVIAFLAAACYSVTGFGFALVMTPLLALVWDTKPAVVTSVLLSTTALLPLLFQVRGHVDVPQVSILVAGSLAGIPVGVLLLERLDVDALNVLILVTVIAASMALYFAPRIAGQGRFGRRAAERRFHGRHAWRQHEHGGAAGGTLHAWPGE